MWPHDSALVAAGLARYGYRSEAERVLAGLLDAAQAFGGRLPELFCGFARDEIPVPVPYPTSCSPQAWAAAVPFQIVRTALGLEADRPAGTFTARPAMGLLERADLDGLRLGNRVDHRQGRRRERGGRGASGGCPGDGVVRRGSGSGCSDAACPHGTDPSARQGGGT